MEIGEGCLVAGISKVYLSIRDTFVSFVIRESVCVCGGEGGGGYS